MRNCSSQRTRPESFASDVRDMHVKMIVSKGTLTFVIGKGLETGNKWGREKVGRQPSLDEYTFRKQMLCWSFLPRPRLQLKLNSSPLISSLPFYFLDFGFTVSPRFFCVNLCLDDNKLLLKYECFLFKYR